MAPSSRLRHSQGAGEESRKRPAILLIIVGALAALATYFVLSPLFQVSEDLSDPAPIHSSAKRLDAILENKAACCRGIEHQELWGSVVVWGSSHKKNSSAECCQACKSKCPLDSDVCTCNSWVFCHDPVRCGSRFGECWLKKQEDPLSPDVQESNNDVSWTSGLVYGKNVGAVQITTEYGAIRLQLLPDCAPLSVAYVIELLKLRHCAGCSFYRAEGRGLLWDANGKAISFESGPPHGIVQGTLEAEGLGFKSLPAESCPRIGRGMVGFIDGGPDFFISLANHNDWYPKHTVFAKVFPEDMSLVEKLAELPTQSSVWSGIQVAVLKKPISLKLQRLGNPLSSSS